MRTTFPDAGAVRLVALVAAAVARPVALAVAELAPRLPDAAMEPLGRLGARGRAPVAPPAVPPAAVPATAGTAEPQRVGSGTPGGLAPALAHRLLGVVDAAPPEAAFADPVGAELRALAGGGATDAVVAVVVADGYDAFAHTVPSARVTTPDAVPLTTALLRALAGRPPVAEQLDVVPTGPASEVAAGHGRGWFALAVVAAAAVARATRPARSGPEGDETALVVGWALDAVTELLAEVPMPPAWAAAHDAELRAGFLLPRMSSATVLPDDGRIGLLPADTAVLPPVPPPGNGLVSAVPGGIVVHTGSPGTPVRVVVECTAHAPDQDTEPSVPGDEWEQVVEIGYDNTGPCRLLGAPHTVWPDQHDLAFPWATSVRARVQASGRGSGGGESYAVRLWEAPAAPAVVLRDDPVPRSLPAVYGTPLIRTAVGDDATWAAALERMTTPNSSGLAAGVGVVDDPEYADATPEDLLAGATPSWSRNHSVLFVADAGTLASPELPVLVVGLHGEDRGRTFRVVAEELWSVENNLSMSNMDFHEFASATRDGVFRVF